MTLLDYPIRSNRPHRIVTFNYDLQTGAIQFICTFILTSFGFPNSLVE
jgi:hypothetical protein